MVAAEVAAANDDDAEVRAHISQSLKHLGKDQPNLVISTCKDFMVKNPKVHRQKICHRLFYFISDHHIFAVRFLVVIF